MATKQSKPRILIIDDQIELVEILADFLMEKGYAVETATNGADGMKAIQETPPNLIVLDMNMPKMSGISVYHQTIANKYDGSPKIPVIVMTGRGELKKMFEDFKINAFIEKPFDLEQFLATVENVLKNPSQVQAADASVQSGSNAAGSLKTPECRAPSSKKILIVEDDERTFDSLVTTFMNAGYKVLSVMNAGEEVVSDTTEKRIMLSLKTDRPDVIMIKFDAKNLNCREMTLASRLREEFKSENMPIILYPYGKSEIDESCAQTVGEKTGATKVLRSFQPAALLRESENALTDNRSQSA